jgi:hypothetical protein
VHARRTQRWQSERAMDGGRAWTYGWMNNQAQLLAAPCTAGQMDMVGQQADILLML